MFQSSGNTSDDDATDDHVVTDDHAVTDDDANAKSSEVVEVKIAPSKENCASHILPVSLTCKCHLILLYFYFTCSIF